jgi:hypothetical protein
MYEFGSGSLWAVPTITLAGAAVTYPTPVPFGGLQDVSIDMSFTMKELFGQYVFPIAVARGTAKLTAKAKAAKITASLFNQVFGEAVTTPAENKVSFQEVQVVPAVSPFTVPVTNQATWTTDLGVIYASTMLPLTRAATATGIGVYSVTAGTYTFASADAAANIKISYIYTTTVAPGQKFTINNQLLGLSPFFSMTLSQAFQGKNLTMTFNRCVASKLSLGTKLEDFNIPELDISMMADDSNVVGSISVYEY